MKKAINRHTIILISILIFGFMFCSACTNTDIGVSKEKVRNGYGEVIEQYKLACEKFDADTTVKYKTGSSNTFYDADGKMFGYEYVKSGPDTRPTKYAYVDLDNNGIEELIISNDNYINNIYSIVDGEVVLTCNGGARSRLTLLENNLLLNEGSGGAAIGSLTIYKYCLDGFNKEKPFKESFKIIEELSWEYYNDGYTSMPKVKIIDSEGEESEKQVYVSELTDLQNNIKNKYKINSDVEWLGI